MTDWIPVLRPSLLTTGELTALPPGRLFHVRRGGRVDAFLSFGENGRITHWLRLSEPEPGRVFDAQHARPEKGLVIDVADRLRVAVRHGGPDPYRMASYFGCVGITENGPIYCGAWREPGFGDNAPVYLSLRTFEPLTERGGLDDAVWFSQWDVLYHDDETDERRAIFSSPHREA